MRDRYIVTLSATIFHDTDGRSVLLDQGIRTGVGVVLDTTAFTEMKTGDRTAIQLLMSKTLETLRDAVADHILRHRTARERELGEPCPQCHHSWRLHLNLNGCCARNAQDQYCYCQEMPSCLTP